MLPPATALLPTWQNEGRSGFLVLCLLAGIPMPEEMLRVIVTSVTNHHVTGQTRVCAEGLPLVRGLEVGSVLLNVLTFNLFSET